MIKLELEPKLRTIIFRIEGALSADELDRLRPQISRMLDSLGGGEHIVLADMRGLAPMSPEAAGVMGDIIRTMRERGTALCVHLSDSGIARLQAARLAREATPQDEITVNVASLAEAWRLVNERRGTLARPAASPARA